MLNTLSKKNWNILVIMAVVMALLAQYFAPSWFYFLKPLTTICIIAIPFLFAKRPFHTFTKRVLLALFFCLLGDVFLLWETSFVFGLGSFLIAHLFFTWSFVSLCGFQKDLPPLLAVSIFGLVVYGYLFENMGDLAIPVAVYILVITTMCWQGIAMYRSQKSRLHLWICLAVIAFTLSDTIIAINKFKHPFELSQFFILTLYWLSIALLANATIRNSSQ